MARITIQKNVEAIAPIERILGQHAEVLNSTPLAINNYVQAEVIEVSFPDSTWPEEHAKLNLFPIEDGKYYLQIMYLEVDDKQENAEITWMEFQPEFFEQYPLEVLSADKPFKSDKVTEQQFTICTQTSALLEQLQSIKEPSEFTRILKRTEVAMQLLRRSMECIIVPFTVCPVPACRFLANDNERDKIAEAQHVIHDHLDSPLTIKELSRKVAMNECYLKKGFKSVTGKTIHQYTKDLRIAKAKDLLAEGLSVSDVANTLGYSSISHFSTAFKKATGTKPCELLQ